MSGSSAYELEAGAAPTSPPHSELDQWTADRFFQQLLAFVESETQRPRGRSFKVEVHAKTLRDRSAQGLLDQFCELVVTHLGMGLGVPVVPMWLVPVDALGPCLLSPFLGETRLEEQLKDPTIRAELATLAAFEEWVMNEDDKPDHLRVVVRRDETRHVLLLDHGHTLHAWKQGMDAPDQIRAHPRLLQQSSGYKSHDGFASDLSPHFDRIKRVGDDQIAAVTRTVLEQYDALRPGVPEVDVLLAHREQHTASVVAILAARRDNLDAILRLKYG